MARNTQPRMTDLDLRPSGRILPVEEEQEGEVGAARPAAVNTSVPTSPETVAAETTGSSSTSQ